jgi:hypothetical protein
VVMLLSGRLGFFHQAVNPTAAIGNELKPSSGLPRAKDVRDMRGAASAGGPLSCLVGVSLQPDDQFGSNLSPAGHSCQ